ncbi:type I-B CRISPR-associated protein Cas8b1/Cst1 [Caloranaerobacter azorensis]|uniref:Type I-B CRISPR-associated protein Cas8b1/Cst1 n=1 Tax=Caloranaerobacter azorensis TaxID=116090 RepID=A0A6P1YD88_9FIRM|nr:type I-B CRISPR-associated protein Cas8b1/Cst1 [Caloranaerobacter azorensis]QIB27299.1 type I-B CRISPR-associated protein Cas8b1/Cst1 [Caloranaerobacter azorensis]
MSYFEFTGNPFVDAGIWGIMAWLNKKSPMDIEIEELKDEFEDITNLYTTDQWKKLMHYLFPNNPIVNPSYKGKHKKKYIEYLNKLTNQIKLVGNNGTCISCGKRGIVSQAKRNNVPLTGSGKLRNYFSYAQEGADYCPVCILSIQFLPLVLYICGGRVILISSDSKKVMRRWANKCIEMVRRQILLKEFERGINENYMLPHNSLFHIVGDLILEKNAEEFKGNKVSIRVYYFTNYGQSPDIEIFDLPSKVFSFLVYLKQTNEYKKWFEVVNRGFLKEIDDEEEKYKKYRNIVYEKLLNNESIIHYFMDNERNTYGTWNILNLYLKEVREMDDRKIELIKNLGDKIAIYIKNSDKLKRLTDLERAQKYYEFTNILRLISKDRIKQNAKEPLFSLDDYVEIVYRENYPEWKEVRDLILFRIYENLHDWLISKEEYKKEVEREEIS